MLCAIFLILNFMQWWLGCVRIMHVADQRSFIPWLVALWKWSCPGYDTPNQTCIPNQFTFFKIICG